jgi:DNA-cytosine methyltransferase
MIVLSLFDGISAGRVALEKSGIKVDKYYASEIDSYAIKISNKNYPDIIQLGDVTNWRNWDIDWSSIDLIIGGSPCQGFSFAGKQLNFDDPRSKLFFEFVDIRNNIRTHNENVKFLLENVRMKQEYQDVISKYLGVNPIMINSSLLSAQNRVRLYWTNISNVVQPDEKGILLKDIIQYEVGFNTDNIYTPKDFNENSLCHHVGNACNINGNESIKRIYAETGKSPALDTMQGGNRQPKIRLHNKEDKNILIVNEATKKGYCEVNANEGVDLTFINSKTRRGRLMKEKSNCLTATNYDYCFFNGFIYRKLTPVECERLQTFPDNYTEGVSNSQRYKALGNSWTVDVISHIFNNII